MNVTKRNLKRRVFLELKRIEENEAKRQMESMTPLSPLGRNIKIERRAPIPAPKRSEKYILLIKREAVVMAKDMVRPAKKKGRLRIR